MDFQDIEQRVFNSLKEIEEQKYSKSHTIFFSTLINPAIKSRLSPREVFMETTEHKGFCFFHLLACRKSETAKRIKQCLSHPDVTAEILNRETDSGLTAITIAILANNQRFIEVFFGLGLAGEVAKFECTREGEMSALNMAFFKGSLEIAEKLLKLSPGLSQNAHNSASFLVNVCNDSSNEEIKKRCVKILALLLGNEGPDKSKSNVLSTFIEANNSFLFEEVLKIDSSLVHVKDEEGWTPFTWSCIYAKPANVYFTRRLVEFGADLNVDCDGFSPIARWIDIDWDVALLLLQNGCRVISESERKDRSLSAFFKVVNQDDEAKLRTLLEYSNPDFTNCEILNEYLTSFSDNSNSIKYNERITELLVAHKAQLRGASLKTDAMTGMWRHNLFTTLMFDYARHDGRVKLYLKFSDNFDYIRHVPYTLLSLCIMKDWEHIIRLAMKKGADLSLQKRSFCKHNPIHRWYQRKVFGGSCDNCGTQPLAAGTKVKTCYGDCDLYVCQTCYYSRVYDEDFSPENLALRKGFQSSLNLMRFSRSEMRKELDMNEMAAHGEVLLNAKILLPLMLRTMTPEDKRQVGYC